MKKSKSIFSIIITFGFIFSFMGCSTMGGARVSDSHKPGKTKMHYKVKINAPKSEVWDILADYDNLSWTEGVIDAYYIGKIRNGKGMTRHCNLDDGGYVVERIVAWDKGNGFTYIIVDASGPLSNDSYAIWTVRGNEKQSTVGIKIHYELKYGIIGDMMNTLMAKKKFSDSIAEFMDEFKVYAEKKS